MSVRTAVPTVTPANVKELVFHVSPSKNDESIRKQGIEPIFSKGKRQASYWVDGDRLLWAIAHCSSRHNLPVNHLTIWAVQKSKIRRLFKQGHVGVFYTTCRIVPDTAWFAKTQVSEDE